MTNPTTITGVEKNTDLVPPYSTLVEFYRAFNQADLNLMTRNWCSDDKASMSNPLGGVKRGWNEIKEVYRQIFNGPAEVYVEFYDYSIHQTENMFCAVGKERGYFKRDNNEIKLAIRTSRTFILEEGVWRQLHHHGSIDNPELLANYQQAVIKE